jgi:YggT family protein
MFVLGIALEQIARLIDLLAWLYFLILLGRVICSWVQADQFNPIVRFLWMATEPVLAPIRRVIPPLGGLDFSVLVAIVVVQIGIQGFLVRTLLGVAVRLQ